MIMQSYTLSFYNERNETALNLLDQPRISQLTSSYAPQYPPAMPLGFGDYLSILWRLDLSAGHEGRMRYYRACAIALSAAMGFRDAPLGQLVRATPPGELYFALRTLPYNTTERPQDADERSRAIQQLLQIRADVVGIGVYQENWENRWPGSGIADQNVRDRIHAVLFTALPSQYPVFARLVLVVDIVLQELLTGSRKLSEFDVRELVASYKYPDPRDPDVQRLYNTEQM
jgi:hypothetical protein